MISPLLQTTIYTHQPSVLWRGQLLKCKHRLATNFSPRGKIKVQVI